MTRELTKKQAIKMLSVLHLGKSRIAKEACEMAIQALEQTTWNPVTERPPKYGQEVLCFLESNEYAVLYRDTQWGENVWLDGGMGTGSYDVIAWMPLPKRYEPQERSK